MIDLRSKHLLRLRGDLGDARAALIAITRCNDIDDARAIARETMARLDPNNVSGWRDEQ